MNTLDESKRLLISNAIITALSYSAILLTCTEPLRDSNVKQSSE